MTLQCELQFIANKPISTLTTLGIGGPAKLYVEVKTVQEMQAAIRKCREENFKYFVLGKGSNCLFDDQGLNGCLIHNKIDFCEHDEQGCYYVGAGYSFSRLGVHTARDKWGGLEFACGIPASVGGAVFMNAGANGGETKDFLKFVDFVDHQGTLQRFQSEEIVFGYRYSSFQDYKGAIVAAAFNLVPSNDAREKQLAIIRYRQTTQPYGDKSAGCVFRNVSDQAAGRLIDSCELKGIKIGSAQVSNLHANFLINAGSATSADFKKLIEHVREIVLAQKGVHLESEIRIIPYELPS